ncbi:protein containing PASTA domain protein [human gut metagenome]|uniref:Protein containing PASTA domain protein n=1 Tax=human gut metagenome TaxID=408170 RepID=K1TJA1_9ZZZZ
MLVSQGSNKKTVPDVRGMADATAQSTIKSYGFNVGTVTYDYSDSVEKGMVISQTVEPGTKASAGTSISITVSNGPKPENWWRGYRDFFIIYTKNGVRDAG